MVILIDTNILLDFFLHREPGYLTCKAVIDYCVENHGKGYVAFYSIPTIFYVLRKYADLDKRKSILKDICSILTVTGANHEDVVEAIDREDFSDFEDCLQMYCAKGIDADYIVTNIIRDYSSSDIPAITSEQMVELKRSERCRLESENDYFRKNLFRECKSTATTATTATGVVQIYWWRRRRYLKNHKKS